MFSAILYMSTPDIYSSSRVTEEISVEGERSLDAKKPSGEEDAGDGNKDKAENDSEEKDLENKVCVLYCKL